MQKNKRQFAVASLLGLILMSACSEEGTGAGGNAYSNTAGRVSLNAAPTDENCARMSVGPNGDMGGFVPFPRDNPWNLSIAGLASDPNSAQKISDYVNRISYNPQLHADFSSVYGEVYNVVDSSVQASQMISIDQYPGESDMVPVPLPNTSIVKGGGQNCTDGGDCHMFILDRNQCWLYETWLTSFDGGRWHASNMAVWDMLNSSKRPYGWTAADAAGLSVFAGLVRYDEVAKGEIPHAIRFTLNHTGNSFVAPATHSAGNDTSAFPMGTRFRLKANFDISSYSSADQTILTAMKNYGMILADNGTDLEIAGANDPRWDTSDVVGLQSVHLTDFEVMAPAEVMTRADLPRGNAPIINGFSLSESKVGRGQPVTLSWDTNQDSWDYIDVIGPVRGNSVTVAPTATTTYTLNSTNAYGRSTRSVTVQVY